VRVAAETPTRPRSLWRRSRRRQAGRRAAALLLVEGLDQIDLTGPFEVPSRIPNSTYRVYAKNAVPVADIGRLKLAPGASRSTGRCGPSTERHYPKTDEAHENARRESRLLGQSMEHFQGTGEVELCEIGDYHEAKVERAHAVAPGGLKRARNSVGVAEIALENARSMRRRDPNPHRIATLSICASVSSRARLA
jgi:hypothetical protein